MQPTPTPRRRLAPSSRGARGAGGAARRRARRARCSAAVSDSHSLAAALVAPRVAYQGMPGAYSERAALLAYPSGSPTPCEAFEGAFAAVEQWTCDRAVLPIENSLGGSIHRNYDLLLQHRLHIVGEVSLKVHHCLMALPGTKIEELERVASHPQALAQCEGFLDGLGVAGLKREAVYDTAGAAADIAERNLVGSAAIASKHAAEIYGLEISQILRSGIQDDASNVTRFMALSREPLTRDTVSSDAPADGDENSGNSVVGEMGMKTSVVFTLNEGPGMLFKALSVFALRDIDMTKIESRPLRTNPLTHVEGMNSPDGARFNYLFYLDFLAGMDETRAQNALRHLQEISPFLRVLGSYPASPFQARAQD